MKSPWIPLAVACASIGANLFYFSNAGADPVLSISPGNPKLLSWSTNVPSFGLETSFNGGVSWSPWGAKPVVVGTRYVVTNVSDDVPRWYRLVNRPQLTCVNHLKQIGIALEVWTLYNNDRFPFQVPVSQGGTREFRQIGPDGFDTNTWRHFQVASNELFTPSLLVCPGDLPRVAATNFETLAPENVTYRLRTVDSVQNGLPGEVLAVCPIDGNTLYCNGGVVQGTNY